jgi:hypothetical protein
MRVSVCGRGDFMTEQKRCVHCGRTLPLSDFHSWVTRRGLQVGKWCQACYESSGLGRRKRKLADAGSPASK